MTLDEFVRLAAGKPFCIRYVERGEHGKRSMGFLVMWTADYFTSDTDRLSEYPELPHREDTRYLRGWGATVEEAIDALLDSEISQQARRAKGLAEQQRDAEVRLAELRARRARKP